MDAVGLSMLVCLALSTCHFSVSPLHKKLHLHRKPVASFSGGAAAGYVFLHLFPELEASHTGTGSGIHAVVLFGFVLLYSIDTKLRSKTGLADDGAHGYRVLRIGFATVYSFLIAYTMSENLPLTPLTALAFTLALGLHTLSLDMKLIDEFGHATHRSSRLILTVALLSGWLLSYLTEIPEVLVDSATAMMAGFIVFTVFSEELQDQKNIRIFWFAFGAFVYFMLEVISRYW